MITPIIIPITKHEPEKTVCPKCGYDWVKESGEDVPLCLMAFVALVMFGFIIGMLCLGLTMVEGIDIFEDQWTHYFGFYIVGSVAIVVLCGLIDLIGYCRGK